ncbi:MAG: PD40 domain-containing protein [Candidatus Aminicenantes bacterium]|nr:PD40 domain-containing protein [Candidatus Aminicenantes bacterium]
MNPTKIHFLFFIAILILFSFTLLQEALSQESAEQLYEAALFKKEAEGNLEGAIEIFRKIIAEFPENRKIAAKAQLQIGLCYEKLGLKEAQKAFQNVVDNYPEQTEMVNVAKQKLSRLLRAKTVIEKGDKRLRMRKVFTGHPRDFVGTPSPDGRYLSTVDWETGDLAIKEIPTGKLRRLTHKESRKKSQEYAFLSIWSPDGKKVAYSWLNEEEFFELRIIGLDGAEPRILYRNKEKFLVQPFEWSPDGKHILAGLGEYQRITQIATISVLDGSVHILKEGLINSGLYSSDGNFIIYDFVSIAQESRGSDIALLPVQGGEEISLVKHPAHDFSLCWDLQGERLLFMSDRTGNMDIWALEVQDGKPQGKPYLIKKNMGRISPLGFTESGALYYEIYTSMEDVYTATLDLEQNSLLALPSRAESLFIGANGSPDFSPDGKYLAYISKRTFGPGRFEPLAICILSLESGIKRELFPDLENMRFIRWSADGKNFFSFGFDKKGLKGLYSIDAQTGEVDLILKCKILEEFIPEIDVFPDGKKIVYKKYKRAKAGTGSIMSIRVRDIQSGKEEEIYHEENASESHHVALSSDGKWIAFDDIDSRWILKVIRVTGGDSRELCRTRSGESLSSFDWRPDSREIFFTKWIKGKKLTQLWRLSLEGEEPQRIELPIRVMREFCFHPDGKRIAFSAAYREVEIWVMENLLRLKKVEKIFK